MNAFRDDQMIEVIGEGALQESGHQHHNGHHVGIAEEFNCSNELQCHTVTFNQNRRIDPLGALLLSITDIVEYVAN